MKSPTTTILITLVLVLSLYIAWDSQDRESSIQSLRANRVTIAVSDSLTGEGIKPDILFRSNGSGEEEHNHFPNQVCFLEHGIVEIMWIDSAENLVTPEVTAKGYLPVRLENYNSIVWGGSTAICTIVTVKLEKAQPVAGGDATR